MGPFSDRLGGKSMAEGGVLWMEGVKRWMTECIVKGRSVELGKDICFVSLYY